MALYSKKQLKIERSKGLQLSDEENEAYNEDGSLKDSAFKVYEWTQEEFNQWLNTKLWDEETKNHHRNSFTGKILFTNHGTFKYL